MIPLHHVPLDIFSKSLEQGKLVRGHAGFVERLHFVAFFEALPEWQRVQSNALPFRQLGLAHALWSMHIWQEAMESS